MITDRFSQNQARGMASLSAGSDALIFSLVTQVDSHSVKLGEGCCCVAFHPIMPLLASGGADGRVMMYKQTA